MVRRKRGSRAGPCRAAFVWLLLGCGATAHPAEPLVGDFHSLDSPFRLDKRLWAGGWLDAPQRVPWPDRIYSARLGRDGWSALEPLRWVHDQNDRPPGELPGYDINHPVVLPDPEHDRLLMFYARFPHDAMDLLACDPQLNPADCVQTERYAAGWMTSEDAGVRWRDEGLLLEPPGGVRSLGAIVRDLEVWLYYTQATLPEAAASAWRQRISVLGMLPVGAPVRLLLPESGLTNLDVRAHDGRIYLAGNRVEASEIHLYESDDGVVFRQPACWQNPVVSARGVRLDGPHVESLAPLTLLSVSNAGDGRGRIVRWTVAGRCEAD